MYCFRVRFAAKGGEPYAETADLNAMDAPTFCRLRRQNVGEIRGRRGAAMGPGVEKPQATVLIAFGENAPEAWVPGQRVTGRSGQTVANISVFLCESTLPEAASIRRGKDCG